MATSEPPGDTDRSAFDGLPALAVISSAGAAQLLMVPGESGDVEKFPVQQASKKTALRFAVGEPGRRGTIWRLWANRDTDDLYLASRNTAGEMKVSLHQSGDWRMQIVNPERPKTVHFHDFDGSRDGRILDRWTRPEPNAIGWTHALSIVLPERHLVAIPSDNVRPDDVRWCPAPRPGEQVEFEINIVIPQQGSASYRELIMRGGSLAVMDALQLASGNVAIVLAYTVPTTPGEARFIARLEAQADLGTPPAAEFDPSPHLGPRRLMTSADPSGQRRYYDLAFGADSE